MTKSTHKPSLLLSAEENDSIFNGLENKVTSLSTAVIQLVVSCPPDHSKWQPFSTGVICFVKNNRKRSYYFRLYDFDTKEKVWEQEIYLNMEYSSPETKFHTFETETGMAGLSFADESEANHFKEIVKQKIQLMNKTFGLNKNTESNITENNSLSVPQNLNVRSHSLESIANTKRFTFRKLTKTTKTIKAKINKLEIGQPTNFRHIQHIGWSPDTGFDFNVIDPNLHNFFSLAGITENQLQNKEIRKFIFDFIDSHGGIQTAIQESAQQELKSRSSQNLQTKAPLKNEETVVTPELSLSSKNSSNVCSTSGPPPPPPPPPPSCIIKTDSNTLNLEPKMSSNMSKSLQNLSSDRNELLEQIRSGISLKKTEHISHGSDSKQIPNNNGNPLATALSKALQNRFRVNQMTHNSSEESDGCDETHSNEWSD